MTNDEQAFLNAICAHPADDTARLVYADWLAEHGQEDRGEFIRVQIEFERTPPTTEDDERRRKVLLNRRDALLKRHKAEWLAPFMPFVKETAFERGFVQSLDVPANAFLENAEKWFALTPLTCVRITVVNLWDPATHSPMRWVEQLLSSPLLSRLESINLESLQLTAADLQPLAAHKDLSRLRELLLARNHLRSEGAALLANTPWLRHLESLDLCGNGISDSGARAIAQSAYLGGLTALRMSRNPIRDSAWSALENRFGDVLVG